MIRSGQWKLWTYAGDWPPALFDLEKDPGERNDLGASADHAETREALLKRLREVWSPEHVARGSQEQDSNVKILRNWAKAVQPVHPDSVYAPKGLNDGDVEMLP
jgi:hypothetical protein